MTPYYETSQVKIYYGDSQELLSNLESNSADLFLTDPPFGINYQNHYTTQKHQVLKGDEVKFSYGKWGAEAFRVLKDNTPLFAYTGWSEYPLHYMQLSQSGFLLKEPLIVQKRPSGTADLYGSFQSNCDWLMFAHKGRFTFKTTELIRNKKAGCVPNKGRKPVPEFKTRFLSCWFGEDYPTSTENPVAVKDLRHPTIKTVEVFKWLILLSTNEGDTVIDPFMGSGTTLLAAKESGRKAIGFEIKEEFCEMAVKRVEKQNDT